MIRSTETGWTHDRAGAANGPQPNTVTIVTVVIVASYLLVGRDNYDRNNFDRNNFVFLLVLVNMMLKMLALETSSCRSMSL